MQAKFRYGNPLMVDYTPSGAVAAGDVIVVGNVPLVAHRKMAANEKGALAFSGGVYELTADALIADGSVVYWDDTANKITETADGNEQFGFVAPGGASAQDGDPITCIHHPGIDTDTVASGA